MIQIDHLYDLWSVKLNYSSMAKILIVDDDRSIRNTLKNILEYEKYQIEEASDGFECLIKIKILPKLISIPIVSPPTIQTKYWKNWSNANIV